MPEFHKITCDQCERDITTTGNSVDYRIILASQPIPSRGGIVTDMMIYPQLDKKRFFCRTSCLKEWVEKHV